MKAILVKKIGRITYQVHIYFSITSIPTMSDKTKQLTGNLLSIRKTIGKGNTYMIKWLHEIE